MPRPTKCPKCDQETFWENTVKKECPNKGKKFQKCNNEACGFIDWGELVKTGGGAQRRQPTEQRPSLGAQVDQLGARVAALEAAMSSSASAGGQ